MTWGGEPILNIHNWWHSVPRIKSTLTKTPEPLRFGILGAATINYPALIDPIATHPDALIAAIASRSAARAQAQITKYALPPSTQIYTSYESLLADPTLSAIYIPLPNGLHYQWTLAALRAGKHVLIEKPIAANAAQAREIQRVAAETGRVVLEALHWRFHPAAYAVRRLCELHGPVRAIDTRLGLPAGTLDAGDIRFEYKLGGGAAMDLNYVFSAAMYFGGAGGESRAESGISVEPGARGELGFNVTEAHATINAHDAQIDDKMNATFTLAGSVRCTIEADHQRPLGKRFLLPDIMDVVPPLTIETAGAQITFPNYPGAWILCRIGVTLKGERGELRPETKRTEIVYVDDGSGEWGCRTGDRWWTSYRYMLEGFVRRVRLCEEGREGEYRGPWVDLEESVRGMELIDAVYRAAGLKVRGGEDDDRETNG